MKKIHIIRHAKSSWGNEFLTDIDRPLNQRGIKTCGFMAERIYNEGCNFSNVFCSSAIRAQSTIKLISECLDINIKWQVDEKLYTFNSDNLHKWLSSVDNSISEIVIIGHNPALTFFCNELSHSSIQNIPTCGYIQLTSHNNCDWKKIASGTHFELTKFLRPKDKNN